MEFIQTVAKTFINQPCDVKTDEIVCIGLVWSSNQPIIALQSRHTFKRKFVPDGRSMRKRIKWYTLKTSHQGRDLMAKILKKFIAGLNGTDNDVIIKDILTDEELLLFEKWVRIFSEMTPFTIVKALNVIDKKEKTTSTDDVVLIAYIKFFEQKLKHLREGVESYGHLFGQHKASKKDFDGDMYA